MIETITIEEIARAVSTVEPRTFFKMLDRYIQWSETLDRHPGSNGRQARKWNHNYERAYFAIISEADSLLSGSSLLASRIINFNFNANGSCPPRKTEDAACGYYRQLKKHQLELISVICDEVEMIRAMIRQSREMQSVMRKHSPAIFQATEMMTVIRDRISNRPTTLLRVEGRDQKLLELNSTIREINDYEHQHESEIQQEAEENPVDNAWEIYNQLVCFSFSDIRDKKTRIRDSIRELRKGAKFIAKLHRSGYSPRMKRTMDRLMENHRLRTRQFQESILECRTQYYLSLAC